MNFDRCRPVPLADGTLSLVKEHVKIGVNHIASHPFFGLFDEMGAMKSAQGIISSQFLYESNEINRVIVVAPASVRSVWFDPEFGELAKHLFVDTRALISEFHARISQWHWGDAAEPRLRWIITNYEFIRRPERLRQLMPYAGPKTFLILDESSAVKAWNSDQTKACMTLRRACGRVLILNGTPIANNPMDMYSQGEIMSPTILQVKSFFHFRARYAVLGGFQNKQIVEFQNLEDLTRRFAPYVLRRLTRECVDMPPALPSVIREVELENKTWKIYKQMRDDMVAWLSEATVGVASQAAVRSMRLAQITSGFLGGLETVPTEEDEEVEKIPVVEEISREKLNFLLKWHKEELLDMDPNLKLLVWCRFIPELMRYLREVRAKFPTHAIGSCAGQSILGKPKKEERHAVERLLDPRTAPIGPVTVGGTYGTGSLGHNFTACHTMVNLSSDYSYWKALQAAARINRPGQVHPTSYFDIIAVGPNGQKTVDHLILKSRTGKANIAELTTQGWIHALTEE